MNLYFKKHIMYLFWPIVIALVTGVGIFWLIYRILRFMMDEITISNQKFNVRIGVISIESKSTPLSKINNVQYTQGVLGRLFGYGTIYIQSGATFGASSYSYISNPEYVKNLIDEAIDNKVQKVTIVTTERRLTTR